MILGFILLFVFAVIVLTLALGTVSYCRDYCDETHDFKTSNVDSKSNSIN